MGIILPKGLIREMDLKKDETVLFEIQKKENALREMFGRGKIKGKLKENTLKELRKELEGKWL